MAFSLKIEGLKEFSEFLNRNPTVKNAKVSANIAVDIFDIRKTLEERVNENFNVPYSLENVFRGENLKETGNVLDVGLRYEDKKVPLSEYPYSLREISNIRNAIPIHPEEGKSFYIPVNKATQVISRVRRKGSVELPRFRPRFPKFLGTDAQGNKKIFSREQKETWLKFPSFLDSEGIARNGIRANISMLFGPSLSTLAEKIYDKDIKIQAKVDKLTNTVIKSFTDFYD